MARCLKCNFVYYLDACLQSPSNSHICALSLNEEEEFTQNCISRIQIHTGNMRKIQESSKSGGRKRQKREWSRISRNWRKEYHPSQSKSKIIWNTWRWVKRKLENKKIHPQASIFGKVSKSVSSLHQTFTCWNRIQLWTEIPQKSIYIRNTI